MATLGGKKRMAELSLGGANYLALSGSTWRALPR